MGDAHVRSDSWLLLSAMTSKTATRLLTVDTLLSEDDLKVLVGRHFEGVVWVVWVVEGLLKCRLLRCFDERMMNVTLESWHGVSYIDVD